MINCSTGVFGINSSRNAGWNIVIVLGFALQYYRFPASITFTVTITYTNFFNFSLSCHQLKPSEITVNRGANRC